MPHQSDNTAPGQGLQAYATRCYNFWVLRHHLTIKPLAADLYHALLFQWMKQGQPAVIQIGQPDLMAQVGISDAQTLRPALAQLLVVGLLESRVVGAKNRPCQYVLGPEPSQLVAQYSREKSPSISDACQDAREKSPRTAKMLGNNSAEKSPSISGTPLDTGEKSPSISSTPTVIQEVVNTREIFPSILEDGISSNDLSLLKSLVPKNPTPLPPAPKIRRTPAERQAELAAQDAAAQASYQLFYQAYLGGNTNPDRTWKLWRKLEPQDWADIMAYLPEYTRLTQGARVQWRKGSDVFLFQKAWKQPDLITRLRATYDREQNQQNQRSTSNRPTNAASHQRRNAPTPEGYGDL